MTRRDSSGRVNLIDAASLHFALEALRESSGQESLRLDFSALAKTLTELRTTSGFGPADESVVFASVDPGSEAQSRLARSWESAGFRFVGLDFRDCSPSTPAGKLPTDPRERTVAAMIPQIAYAIGTLRRFPKPEVLVVSHAFDFSTPLGALVANGGRAGLCFFKSLLDRRWEVRGGLLEPDSAIKFHDLEPHSKQLVGYELGTIPSTRRTSLGF